MKTCIKCKKEKQFSDFPKNGNRCKACIKAYNQTYYQNNKDQILEQSRDYYQNNIDKKVEYYQENNEQIRIIQKAYYNENKEDILAHKQVNKKQRNLALKTKLRDDPQYRAYIYVSNSIKKMLKSQGFSKNGKSSKNYLPFTYDEYKKHMEIEFSKLGNEWMHWNNQGRYDLKTWDDNDSKTWTWQLDHIIPHSTFHYTSMDSQEFRDCWALSNLRPLSAKQNVIDGNRR